MIREAIILAGGLGTRLRSAVPDLPKCLAPVAGRPFVGYLIDYFREAGIEQFIFALGYKSEQFEEYLKNELSPGQYRISVETRPLGTGGAIQLACGLATDKDLLVLNGDTFFGVSLDELSVRHSDRKADCTLCLLPMRDFDRFGVVELGEMERVRQFREKKYYSEGLINGGVYALNRERFLQEELPPEFSFERDYLEAFCTTHPFFGLVQDSYFIDIGVPEDYHRIQLETHKMRS